MLHTKAATLGVGCLVPRCGVLFLEGGSLREWSLVNRSGCLGLSIRMSCLVPRAFLVLCFLSSTGWAASPTDRFSLPTVISRTKSCGLKPLELGDEINIPSPRLFLLRIWSQKTVPKPKWSLLFLCVWMGLFKDSVLPHECYISGLLWSNLGLRFFFFVDTLSLSNSTSPPMCFQHLTTFHPHFQKQSKWPYTLTIT